MNLEQFRRTVMADLYRVTGGARGVDFARQLLVGEGFRYVFWMRCCAFCHEHTALRYTVFVVARLMLRRYVYRLGIRIPFEATIGPGLSIVHFGGIVVSSEVTIGRNCTLSHGVTLGKASRGPRVGVPTLGDNVYVGPGATVFGAIRIGDNVAIGAGAVVNRDVPDNAVVAGVPARVVSFAGADGYLRNPVDHEAAA